MARGNGELPVRCFYCFVFPFLYEQPETPRMRTPQARERAHLLGRHYRARSAPCRYGGPGPGLPLVAVPEPSPGIRLLGVNPSRVRTPSGKKKCEIRHREDIQRPRCGKLPSKTRIASCRRCWIQPARAQQLITGSEKHNAVIKAEF